MPDPNEKVDVFLQAMYGVNARHIPAWLVVQDQGKGVLTFVGASRTASSALWGASQVHQLMIGEIILRPHRVIASNGFRGSGLTGFIVNGNDEDDWLASEDGQELVNIYTGLEAGSREKKP